MELFSTVPEVKKQLKHADQFLRNPIVLSGLSIFFLLFFVISMILTYGPVVRVEAQYRYNKVLREVFHVTDLRSLILPNINFEIITAKNRGFGMEIPSLYLDEPIIFNVDPHDKNVYQAALKKGIAHAAGTELPGYSGLGYYFAHSSEPDLRNQYNAVFYLLGKLQPGNEIFIWRDQLKYNYVVTETQITAPTDLSFLEREYERPTIVLQTCWPPGTTQKRMLVFAEQR